MAMSGAIGYAYGERETQQAEPCGQDAGGGDGWALSGSVQICTGSAAGVRAHRLRPGRRLT